MTAYIGVLREAYLLDIARISEQLTADQARLEGEKLAAGAGTSVEVLLARSRLQSATERRIVFEGNFEDANSRYAQVYGHPPDLEAMEDPSPPVYFMPPTLDDTIDIALARNPAIANSDRQVDIARARQRTIRAAYFPRLDLVGRANWEEDVAATPEIRRDWSVLLQASWDLFSGFSARSGVEEAAFAYSASLNNRLFTNRKVEEEVRLAWQGLRTACERTVLLKSTLGISREVLASRLALREVGQETDLRVLDAQNELFTSQINLVNAVFDGATSVYRVALVLGKLDVGLLAQEKAIQTVAITPPANPLVNCDPEVRNPFRLRIEEDLLKPASLPTPSAPVNPFEFTPEGEDFEAVPGNEALPADEGAVPDDEALPGGDEAALSPDETVLPAPDSSVLDDALPLPEEDALDEGAAVAPKDAEPGEPALAPADPLSGLEAVRGLFDFAASESARSEDETFQSDDDLSSGGPGLTAPPDSSTEPAEIE